ncbi:dihydrofolate reductase family protein [Microbacterium sp. NPDC090007]|uniref:dihydrofolate reductase family protein n=1 Tax=Microbacterium sp. NPDC090007 TaxID=3364204 RepID=UPI003809465A
MTDNPGVCKVAVAMSVSVDGVAGGEREADLMSVHSALLDWQFSLASWRASQGMQGGQADRESDLWQQQFERFGAQVIGRTMFDFGFEPWGDEPPFHAPVFVLTSTPGAPIAKDGGTTYFFETGGIGAAVNAAVAAADGRDVLVAGGVKTARAALEADLVDEIILHVVPVMLGRGVSLLGALGRDLTLQCIQTIQGERALHLRYAVER